MYGSWMTNSYGYSEKNLAGYFQLYLRLILLRSTLYVRVYRSWNSTCSFSYFFSSYLICGLNKKSYKIYTKFHKEFKYCYYQYSPNLTIFLVNQKRYFSLPHIPLEISSRLLAQKKVTGIFVSYEYHYRKSKLSLCAFYTKTFYLFKYRTQIKCRT